MSLPPPGCPPEVFARSRIKAVAAELGLQADPKLQAALLFELGALTELRLGERERAAELFRDATERDPSFRPALFALARQQSESRDDEALLTTLAKLAHASTKPDERASLLVDIGCLLEDRLNDAAGGRAAFERALEADPDCLAASVMLERALLVPQHLKAATRLVARRAERTPDPRLRSALAVESARELAADGDIDAATEVLLTAMAAPSRKLPILLCLADLALRHGRGWVAARAYEDIGALLAGFAADQTGPEPLEIATRFPDRECAIQAAGYYYHAAAQLHAVTAESAVDVTTAREHAAACVPADVLVGLSLAADYRDNDATIDAQRQLMRLCERSDKLGSARLQFELAELAARQGDDQGVLAHLRSAYRAAPDAPSIHAVFEDRLLDAGDLQGLCDLLETRAARSEGAERHVLLWRAALAAERAQDTSRSLDLWSSLVSSSHGEERTCALRELHGLASRASLPAQLGAAAQELLAAVTHGPERAALLRSRYEAALATQDEAAAHSTLEFALSEPVCDLWAPHTAWLIAALRGDQPLLARAHARLAELAQGHDDSSLAAAHRAAQARAQLRVGANDDAVRTLRGALELAPANPYAVSLLERCLLARGETSAAIDLLREAARAFADRNAQQVALLQAGELAEASGQLELARHSYDEAAARDPGAFSAQWARLRFAERSRDLPRRLSALRALSERELSQRRPGNAHLELGELLAVQGQHAQAATALALAIDNPTVALEAAASAALLSRAPAAEQLRARALTELAERAAQPLRTALEHERTAELLHECPGDALRLLQAGTSTDARDALLRFLLEPTGPGHAQAVAGLQQLTQDSEQQAALALHATRCRTIAKAQDDTDALLHALGLIEELPDALGSSLALCEALDAADDPETRVLALTAYAKQLPDEQRASLQQALARAYLDAGAAPSALSLLLTLQPESNADPSFWESLRACARAAGDFAQVVAACDALAEHLSGDTRAAMLEEAASVLHERLERPAEAERRLREVLSQRPERKPAFERLHDILIERADLDALLSLLSQRISVSESSAERVDLLYETARILRARGERPQALRVTQDLLSQDSTHSGALSLTAEIHTSEERWPEAIDALRRLSATDLPAAQRRLAIEGCAEFLEQKLGDHAAAYRELEQLLALDLADSSVHLRMASLAQQASWPREAAQALSRAAVLNRSAQRAHLERRAAELYLAAQEPAQAAESLKRALRAQPLDEPAFSMLLPLVPKDERAELASRFTRVVQQALAREPADAELLRALLHAGQGKEDLALQRVALFALEALGHANSKELDAAKAARAASEAYRPVRFGDARFTRLMPRELSGEVLRLGQALSAAWLELVADAPERHALRRRSRLGAHDTHPAQAPLREALALFGLDLKDAYVTDTEPHALYPIQSSGTSLSWVLGPELSLDLRSVDLLRVVPLMAAARAQLLGVYAPDVSLLQQRIRLLLVAAGLLQDERLNVEASTLASTLSQPRRLELVNAWNEVDQHDDAVQRLSRGSALLGQRAMLVFAADPVPAIAALGRPPDVARAAGANEPQTLDVLRFWLSTTCSELLRDERGRL